MRISAFFRGDTLVAVKPCHGRGYGFEPRRSRHCLSSIFLGNPRGSLTASRKWALVYPMHSHVEQDQTAAGGNYPQGLITHFVCLGELINGVEVPFPATPVPLNADGTPQRITVLPPALH